MAYDYIVSKQERNYNLDLIKIMACIAVVGLHTLNRDLSSLNLILYYLCGFAVPAFFMASGYILLNRGEIFYAYVWKRIFKIVRVVICWTLIVFFDELLLNLLRSDVSKNPAFDIVLIATKSFLKKGRLWHFWYLGHL